MAESSTRFNPFPGLRSFEPDEDHLFFGRESRIDELLARLRQTRFLAVVGTSGSGKSSLVRSGLIPSLYSGFMARAGSSWRVAILRPGDDPIGNLATALNHPDVLGGDEEYADTTRAFLETTLRRSTLGIAEAVRENRVPPEENILVLVDQFEELFRFKRNRRIKDSADEAVAFVNLLLEASKQEEVPIYIVITMRSDFIGNFTEFQGLAEAFNDGQYLVPRMTREERRSAIVGPVAVGGAEITPRLVLRLLNDVGDDPDQLPILQHSLMRTWDNWEQHHADAEPIDLRHYEAIGTMKSALSQHAEEAFRELGSDRAKEIAEKMFKALTDRASDNRGIRVPRRLEEVADLTEAGEDDVIRVVECFRAPGRSFLMPPVASDLTRDTVVDISHESLMRIWVRLITWVDEEANSAQIYRRLSAAAAQYQAGSVGLFRDPELQLALNWRNETKPTAAWAERYDPAFERAMLFLEHSEKQREREIAEKERHRRRQLQWARRLAVAMGSAFVVVSMLGIYAVMQKIEADERRAEAEAAKIEAQEQREEAVRQKEVAEVERANADRQRSLAEEQRQIADQERVRAVSSEREAVSQRQKAEVARTEAVEAQGEAEAAQVVAVEQRAIAVTEKERADEARVQAEISEQEARRLRMLALARALAVQTTRLREPDQAELAALLARQAYLINADNGGEPSDPTLFNALRTALGELDPERLMVLRPGQEAVRAIAVLADGATVASGGDDGSVALVSTAGPGPAPRVLGSFFDGVRSLAVSADGAHLAAGSLDGSLRLWNLRTEAAAPFELEGHLGAVDALAFSSDGARLASGGADGAVRLWRVVEPHGPEVLRQPDNQPVTALAFSPDGGRLAVASGGVVVLDPTQPAAPQVLASGDDLTAVAFSGDGRLLAAGRDSGAVLLWRLEQSMFAAAAELAGHRARVTDLAFAGTRNLLASSSLDGTVRLWDGDRPALDPIVLADHGAWVWSVALTRGGDRVVSGGEDQTIRVAVTQPEPLAEAICSEVGRNLTLQEWAEYLPSDIEYAPTCPNHPAQGG